MGGGRASGEEIFALLRAQQCISLEGAETGTTRKTFAFIWLFANAQNFMNTEHYRLFWENKLAGAKVRLLRHLPQIRMCRLIFCCLFLENNNSQQSEGFLGSSSNRNESEYIVLLWNLFMAISGILVPVQQLFKKRAFWKMKFSPIRNSDISKAWEF